MGGEHCAGECPLDGRGIRWQVDRVLDGKRLRPCQDVRRLTRPILARVAEVTSRDVSLRSRWAWGQCTVSPSRFDILLQDLRNAPLV